jgi:DNA adenine methylase
MIDKVTGPRLGADIDPDLITMWQAVSKGWLPPESITEEEYHQLRNSEPSPLKGYAAFALSYGGKKWGGWCRDRKGGRDHRRESYRNALKQFPSLLEVEFKCCSYLDLDIPKNSIVYCDPPYAQTTKYKHVFDHEIFWGWVRDISKECTVFVSEYDAPDDFECLWSGKAASGLPQNTNKKSVESLWRLK